MENVISQFREKIDGLLSVLNERAEEVRENFTSFKDVFGKELELQSENFKDYRDKLESRSKQIVDPKEIAENIKGELDGAIRNLRSGVDSLYDVIKERIKNAQ